MKDRINDPTQFVELFKRNEVDYSRYLGAAKWMIGAAAVGGPLAFAAMPALGGMIGAGLFGYSGAAATSAGLAFMGGGSLAAGGFGMLGGTCVVTALGAGAMGWRGWAVADKYLSEVDAFEIVKLRDGKDPALLVVDGFLSQDTCDGSDWIEGLKNRFPGHAVYHVRWEAKRLQDLGNLAKDGFDIAKDTVGYIEQASRATRLAAVQLLPLAAAFGITKLAENPWHVAMVKADMTGELIKQMILRTEGRQFILMGHSLGARAVVGALLGLGTVEPTMRPSRIVEAHLFAGAVGKDPIGSWQQVMNAVDGNCYSYYSSKDQVLSYLYKVGTAFLSDPIGGAAIPVDESLKNRLISIDVSDLANGHTAYKPNLFQFLAGAS